MTSLIKNQVLKHLTKFFKDLAPEQLQLSAFKGSCELSNLQLEEKVLMDLLSFPAWLTINKAVCDQLSIKIPWTKIKSVPIQMNLNEVTVEVEVCEEFRDTGTEDENNLSNLISVQAPGKYGFVDRVIDGITVTVNNVLITFTSKLMFATFNLSRVIIESRCPNWKQGELSLTRVKDVTRGQILLFKIVEWQNMRLEAKCLTDPQQAPLRLITNHAQCRLTIKKNLDDCSVVAARIFVIFEDILWVLTFAQFTSMASFVEYIFTLIKKSPMSKKTGLLDNQSSSTTNTSSTNSSFVTSQQAPLISPMNTPKHTSNYSATKAPILTGNMSSASLTEQKFLCYDLIETSLHLYIDKIDAHLYDDIETSSSSGDSGGALQTTLDQIQVDCYPYSRVIGNRQHWYRWFDPSPSTRKQWLSGHFAEFDLIQVRKKKDLEKEFEKELILNLDQKSSLTGSTNLPKNTHIPIAADEHLLSLIVLVKIKDYCMNCVATKQSTRGVDLNKFIQTDKDYQMPAEMPSLYLELNYFYYFDTVHRMMVYENVPDPLAFMHLSPTKLLFDSPTLLFLNSFQVNLSKAFVHLNDLFPDDTTAPKVHCRIEILMPQISLPAKSKNDQLPSNTSALLVKSGKVILSNTIYDKNLISKLVSSIDKLRESPSQPINFGSGLQSNSAKKENSCTGDWMKVWNASLINKMNEFNLQNQLWAFQFEPVWMDFMNYDVDDLTKSQRLEPIVEPVSAYAFVHLNLSSSMQNSSKSNVTGEKRTAERIEIETANPKNKCDIISILVSVMEGSIIANMDKVQFSFLQRLGMSVEKLFQQIREDASNVIQIETNIEQSLELNLTAYIRDVKARLILDKKTEKKDDISIPVESLKQVPTDDKIKSLSSNIMDASNNISSIIKGIEVNKHQNVFFNSNQSLTSSVQFEDPIRVNHEERLVGVYEAGCDQLTGIGCESSFEPLDECAEVADDASYLFLGDTCPNVSSNIPITTSVPVTADLSSSLPSTSIPIETQRRKSPLEESLLINLDEMEQSSSLFAKVVDLKSQRSSPNPPIISKTHVNQEEEERQQQQQQQQQKQDFETESISYLELSMSQLMVRRITETKRRQKF